MTWEQAMPEMSTEDWARLEASNRERTHIKPPSSDVWMCYGPLAGRCRVHHQSERTALACRAKRERRKGYWRIPHRLDCAILIWGTDYLCNCGAFDRARERKGTDG